MQADAACTGLARLLGSVYFARSDGRVASRLNADLLHRLQTFPPMWYKCCENAEAIEDLYSVPPDLSNIELHEVRMQRDGPLLQLRFDLSIFPDQPPARWSNEATVAQAVVDFWGVSNFMLDGWETSNRGELTIGQPSDGILLVAFESPVSRLHCRSDFARIASVTAYAQEAV